ncbi:DUF3624 family protein [Vibrio chagasii]|nr:DUF3624 family protein [Vibrio chagasii]
MNHHCVVDNRLGVWWLFFREDPKPSTHDRALIMAAFAFSGLLSLHWIMKFVVLPLRNKSVGKCFVG